MKYFNALILKIQDIEDDFSIINSRIIEFSKSTDNEHIDFNLVNKYFDILTEYLSFLKDQKKDLLKNISKKSNKVYLATKKLVNTRIDLLISHIKSNLTRISKITSLQKKSTNNKKTKELYNSSSEMEEIKKLLEEFNKELVFYKKIQKDIGINIDLDDEIEKKIETIETEKSMLQSQRYFLEITTDFLESILDKKQQIFNEIKSRKDKVFASISNKKTYNNLFFNIFKKEYKIGLNIADSQIAIDNKKYSIFNSKLTLLLDVSIFCSSFKNILLSAKEHGFENFLLDFEDTNYFLQSKVLSSTNFDLNRLYKTLQTKIGITKLRAILLYFDNFYKFIKTYNNILNINFTSVDKIYNSSFLELFKADIRGTYLVSKLMKEYNSDLIKKLRDFKIDESNIIKNKNIFLKEQKFLKKLYSGLIESNNKITNYSYSSGKTLSALKGTLLGNLKDIKLFNAFLELMPYYNTSATKTYKGKRSSYLAAQRRASSYNSSGSYSSSSSSSSWSSSSSSFSSSSSYSSSGSSSW